MTFRKPPALLVVLTGAGSETGEYETVYFGRFAASRVRPAPALAFAFILIAWSAWSAQTGPGIVWFDDLQTSPQMTAQDEDALARSVLASLLVRQNGRAIFPKAAVVDSAPRIVFLSVSDGATPARVVLGSGKGILEAVRRAVQHVRGLPVGHSPKWVKVDFVGMVQAVEGVSLDKPLPLERGLEGLALGRGSGIAFLAEELAAHNLVDQEGRLQQANVSAYLQTHGERSMTNLPGLNEVTTYRFTTRGFFSDGERVFPVYRGHRKSPGTTRAHLLSAARAGGRYLARAVGANGRFIYSYDPTTDEVSPSYNVLRHAGTVYAMLELYGASREQELLEASRRAVGYLQEFIKPDGPEKDGRACIVAKGAVKLGGNALAIVALCKYAEVTGDRQYMPVAVRLGRWMRHVQKENGDFIHKQSWPGGDVFDFVSEYYPGEAILALTRLAAIDPGRKGRWLDTAQKGAKYLINVRDKGVPPSELIHDHWLLYALNELYRARPDPSYLDHALRIARAIVGSQNRNPRYPDWLGSYHEPPGSTSTATRTEGLCATYVLARDFGHEREARAIYEAIRLGVLFQLHTQFRPESVMYLKDPQRCLGGFHRSLTDYEIRIDYVQHNISSLLGLCRILGKGE